jgi:hypothetical protein
VAAMCEQGVNGVTGPIGPGRPVGFYALRTLTGKWPGLRLDCERSQRERRFAGGMRNRTGVSRQNRAGAARRRPRLPSARPSE